MGNKQVLVNLNRLQIGDKLKIYSSDKDIFNNEKIDVYTLEREEDGMYVSYSKKNSFEYPDSDINFKLKTRIIGTGINEEMIESMNLTETEKRDMQNSMHIERNVIRKNCNLEGFYEDGTRFVFRNILQIEKA